MPKGEEMHDPHPYAIAEHTYRFHPHRASLSHFLPFLNFEIVALFPAQKEAD